MLKIAVALFVTTLYVSVDAGHYSSGRGYQKPSRQQGNIAEELSKRGFSTLVDLVTKAGLADTLSNQGPFTVFAPTDEAFKVLDPNLVNYLVSNTDELKNVLLYHVVPASVPSSSLSNDQVANSVQGAALRINLRSRPSGVTVNGVDVIKADIRASNGIIHAVDKVLLAPQSDIVGALAGDDRFSTLVAAVTAAGLADTLRAGPFTVFAPTNDAFAKLPAGTVDSLLNNIPALTEVLLRHVVPSTLYSRALLGNRYNTAGGDMLSVSQNFGRVTVTTRENTANVIEADKTVTNGVVHAIDAMDTLIDHVKRMDAQIEGRGFFVLNKGMATTTRQLRHPVVASVCISRSVNMLKIAVALFVTTLYVSVDAGHYSSGRGYQKPSRQQGNIAEELSKRGFSTLVDLVTKAGLADTLSNQGPFTVFAPTDEAFKALDPNLVNYLVSNTDELKNVLLYHVVPASVPSSSLSNDQVANSVQGAALRINLRSRPSGVTVNGVDVIKADIRASNGIIHAVDKVLLAPQSDIVGALAGDDRFSTLVAAVTAAGLADTLRAGPFTVFAPTNDAFAKLPAGTVDSLLNNIPALTEVLLRHVVPSTLYSRALLGNRYNTAGGDMLSVSQNFGRVTVTTRENTANVIEADKTVTNGVVHAIDAFDIEAINCIIGQKVGVLITVIELATHKQLPAHMLALVFALMSPKRNYNITSDCIIRRSRRANPSPASTRCEMNAIILLFLAAGFLSADAGNYGPAQRMGNIAEVLTAGGFNTLLNLVVRADLAESAAEGGPFTIFAPTDKAFEALDPTVRNFLLADVDALTTALLYHVVPGRVAASSLEDGMTLGSATGSPLTVNVGSYSSDVTVNGVRVEKTDLQASNGVVHVIEKVLLPPRLTILEALAGDGRFSTLVTAVSLADLFEALDSDGPFTVFAPTDEALAAVPEGTVESFLQDTPAIRNALLRHVVPSRLYSRALLGKTFTTLNGEALSVFQDAFGRLRVRTNANTATIIHTDATLFNGVVHAIDSVI
ncbi:periostin-like [Penaeus japonicus]|uniref:periostin-like n=1 Tax=Penaeus japonicus TaxID=27405 RepID=UPI001C70CE95|nr:periostin-like [Penaeus japonicus]